MWHASWMRSLSTMRIVPTFPACQSRCILASVCYSMDGFHCVSSRYALDAVVRDFILSTILFVGLYRLIWPLRSLRIKEALVSPRWILADYLQALCVGPCYWHAFFCISNAKRRFAVYFDLVSRCVCGSVPTLTQSLIATWVCCLCTAWIPSVAKLLKAPVIACAPTFILHLARDESEVGFASQLAADAGLTYRIGYQNTSW